jgi:hypothetical protein
MTETKKKIFSFFRMPLVYLFIICGSTIGHYLRMGIAIDIVVSSIGAGIGYGITVGIDSFAKTKALRIALKWIIGVVGFVIYCLILTEVKKSF